MLAWRAVLQAEGRAWGRGWSQPSSPQGYTPPTSKSLPLNDMPGIFVHDNANITLSQTETYTLLGTIVQLQPKSSSAGGKSPGGGQCGREGAPPNARTSLPVLSILPTPLNEGALCL